MMEAVAINSSSNASDTLPEAEYGSSSAFSEYLSKMEWFSLSRLTVPMVQPPDRPRQPMVLADVVQQHHIFMTRVFLDVAVQFIDGHAATFNRLQENAAPVAKNAGNTAGRVVLAGLGQNRFNRAGAGVHSAAGIQQTYQHGLILSVE